MRTTCLGRVVRQIKNPKYKAPMKKVTARHIRRFVFRKKAYKTIGGLKTADLKKNKKGSIVSVKQSDSGRRNPWVAAMMKARKMLKLTGFHQLRKSSALYKLAKKIHRGQI